MKNFFLEGMFCVDSQNDRNIKIIDVKVRKWFDTLDEIYTLKAQIDQKINPQGLSFDQATARIIGQGRRFDPRDFPSELCKNLL